MSLARVLFASGDERAARAAARDARAWYEAKGHAVGVERASRWTDEIGPEIEIASEARSKHPTVEPGARLSAVLGDRPPERFYAEFMRRYARHELDPILALYAEDFVLVDHRRLGWNGSEATAG